MSESKATISKQEEVISAFQDQKKAEQAPIQSKEQVPKETKEVEETNALSLQEEMEGYIALLKAKIAENQDGSWLDGEAHQEAFANLCQCASLGEVTPVVHVLQNILQSEPSLTIRYEALRLASVLDLRKQLLPTLEEQVERAGFYPLMRRRLEAIMRHWKENDNRWLSGPLPPLVEASRARVHQALWLSPPQPNVERLQEELLLLSKQGEPGLFGIARLLREQLEERYLMTHGTLTLFLLAADLFVQHQYFEGVQVFFDFLAECKPIKPGCLARKAVGAVLKAVRKLHPYRYPQWALPLRRFVEHYRSIKRKGRAAEANMLIILITASTIEDALLLEDDELVDLLRGRRDAALTEEALRDVGLLCDMLLEAGRTDSRILHIRGWLAARLEGLEVAEPYFHQAIEQQPEYLYSHLALSSIYEQWGEDDIKELHLQIACDAKFTLISCQRKYGEMLQRAGLYADAEHYYRRGTEVQAETNSVLELEEFFGCYAALANLYVEHGEFEEALNNLDQLTSHLVFERFGARFCLRQKVIVDLLHKGLRDFRAEIQRSAEQFELM